MTEEATTHTRRKQPLMRTVGKHGNRSSTRLSKMGRGNNAAGITPLTKLTADNPIEGGAPRFLGERTRERSSDSLPRVHSAGRLPGKHNNSTAKLHRKAKHAADTVAPRKAVINLEHEDSDNDSSTTYEDTESEGEGSVALEAPPAEPKDQPQNSSTTSLNLNETLPKRPDLMRRTSSGLSVGIKNVAPTPPQISTETVVSVTSAVDMANALNSLSSKSQFVEEGDFVSRAMTHSHSAIDLKGIVGANPLRTQQKLLVRQQQSHSTHGLSMPEAVEARRGYERAVKEYINARQLASPVKAALLRAVNRGTTRTTPVPHTLANPGSTGEASDSQLNIASLSATTVDEMAGLTVDDHKNTFSGQAQHMSNYLLLNLWNEGWTDPEKVNVDASNTEDIQSQAQKVYQRISAPQWSGRRSSTVKLV